MQSTRLRWLAWDGVLPLVAVTLPSVFALFANPQDREIVAMLASFALGLILAFVRCSVASETLSEMFDGRRPVGRQLLFALSIVVLMFFELIANFIVHVLPGAQPPPPPGTGLSLCLIAAGLFFAYGVLVSLALRPPRRRDAVTTRDGEPRRTRAERSVF